jgi:hypothetical protein
MRAFNAAWELHLTPGPPPYPSGRVELPNNLAPQELSAEPEPKELDANQAINELPADVWKPKEMEGEEPPAGNDDDDDDDDDDDLYTSPHGRLRNRGR